MSHPKHTPETVVAALIESGFNLGATLFYPQDRYGYVVIDSTKSGKTLTIMRLETVDMTTGHTVDHFDGPFPVWSHTYTEDEMRTMRRLGTETIKWSEPRKGYMRGGRKGTPFLVGVAQYHRNYSY